MRSLITASILALSAFSTASATAQGPAPSAADLVDSWYVRYLGRNVDPAGLQDHVSAIQQGASIQAVEASILSSPEYYARNGNSPEGYVAALHRDVLNERAGSVHFARDVNFVLERGRTAAALQVLNERTPVVVASSPVVYGRPGPVYVPRPAVVVRPAPVIVARPRPVIVAPRPVIVAPRPVVVTRPRPVVVTRPGPVVVTPRPGYRPPVVVAPRPGISVRIGIR